MAFGRAQSLTMLAAMYSDVGRFAEAARRALAFSSAKEMPHIAEIGVYDEPD